MYFITNQLIMKYLLSVFTILIAFSSNAQLNIEGVTLPATLKASSSELVLNGGGLREKYFLDLYVSGLYLESKNTNADAIIKADEPMAIRIEIVSKLISSDKMVDAIEDGMKKSTGGNTEALSTEIAEFKSAFSEEIVVGDIVPDSKLGWFEAVVSKETGFKLGIFRNIQAIIWDNKITENHLIEIYRNIKYKKIKVSDKSSKPNKNWVLPNALVKEMFGDFQIKERDGTWIITEPKWREENIQTIKMPIIGRTTCHRLMWEPLRGALNQVKEEGLANTLYLDEFKTSGGCYAPRRISRFDAGGSLSRHAWGIAIDINTKSGYVPRVVEIFNSWGFAWGGTWTSPDEMHFELRDLSASISKTGG